MATPTQERLISADDHVDLAHDSVKAHLASKYHDAYDAALREFAASMTQPAFGRGEPALARAAAPRRAAVAGRHGHGPRPDRLRRGRSPRREGAPRRHGPRRRRRVRHLLRGLGVPLPVPRARRSPGVDARVQHGARGVRVRRPEPADRLVPDPDPRHRRRDRRGAVGGRERLQVAAAPGVPGRARRSPTTGTRATSRCSRRSRRPGSRSAATSG